MPVNWVSSNVLAVLGWAALAVAGAAQEQIATRDGLALQLSPDGKVSRVIVDGQPTPVGKAPGGFFIADVEQALAEQPNLLLNPSGEAGEDGDEKPDARVLEDNRSSEGPYQPVLGRLEARGDTWAFAGVLPPAGLELEATWRADKECLRVEGVVHDTTGGDRAGGVRFALPLDLAGWTWYDDTVEYRPIAAESLCRHTYDTSAGVGVSSVYPWSALSGPEVGLSLALPVSQGPRVFLIQHDQRVPETSVTFYFGLARDAAKNPGCARNCGPRTAATWAAGSCIVVPPVDCRPTIWC